MKTPKSYSEAVKPETPQKQKETAQVNKEIPKWEFVNTQVVPIMALDKQCENFRVEELLKSCYTNYQYVDTDNPIKTRKYYEFILADTDSIKIEHHYFEKNP
ncbi:hypothetical protein K7X08_023173 [Anisodus acutangulus]|uniref:Uncharacterized protein n=1 Tax=Anisodus acutangulus TaxID=402998 RepID=A0A9Q1LED2_9SOLA|nr:hypothetical protein K7X08_023173 [Anisodus acutangulus]